jgi:hypothetical protein
MFVMLNQTINNLSWIRREASSYQDSMKLDSSGTSDSHSPVIPYQDGTSFAGTGFRMTTIFFSEGMSVK